MEDSTRPAGSTEEAVGASSDGTVDGFNLPHPSEVPKRPRGRPVGTTGSPGSGIVDKWGHLKSEPSDYTLFTLDYAFRHIGGRESAIQLAKLVSASDERMATVVQLYKGLSAGAKKHAPKLLEKLCLEAGLDPSDFLGKCAAAAHKHQFGAAALLASSSLEAIVETGTDMAKRPEGIKDRELIYEHMSFLPQKKGVGVAIQVNAGQGSANILPNFADLAQLATQAIGSDRQITEGRGEAIDGELISTSVFESGSAASAEQSEIAPEEDSR